MLKLFVVISYIGYVCCSGQFRDLIAVADAPFYVTIELDNGVIGDGALLAPNWVVVLGRSITWLRDDDWNNHVQIRAGSDRRSDGGQTKKTLNHTWHPKFDANEYDYNVAMLELDGGFNIGGDIQTVSLGGKEPLAGSSVDVTGYGSFPDQGSSGDRLQRFNVSIIARTACRIAYQDYLDDITDRNICGGMPEGDLCYGESGNPVVQDGGLVALYASSLGCHRDGMPAIFTNLLQPEIRSFIEDHISGA